MVEAGKEFDLVMVFWVSPSRPEGWASGCGGEHRVGPRFVLSALQELLVLLPHVALELQFVGDGLPPESDQQHFTLQRVRVEYPLPLSPTPVSRPGPSVIILVGQCPSDPCLPSPVLPDTSSSTITSTGLSPTSDSPGWP